MRLRRDFDLNARSFSQLIRSAQGDLVAWCKVAEDLNQINALLD